MSATTRRPGGGTATAPRPAPRSPRPASAGASARSVALAPVHRSSRGVTLLAAAALMVATLMAVLLLNIARSRASYEDQRLTARQTLLAQQQQALTEALRASSAPAVLASRASALGMVPDPDPGYLRLSDGAVLGSPTPAGDPTTTAGATGTAGTSGTTGAGGTATRTASAAPSARGAPSAAATSPSTSATP